jgi:prophage regulatory protein
MNHAVTSFAPSERALRIGYVCDKTGISRTHLYRLIASGKFPAPVHISERVSVWREADINLWLHEKFSTNLAMLPPQELGQGVFIQSSSTRSINTANGS